jgi:hypothetical protein
MSSTDTTAFEDASDAGDVDCFCDTAKLAQAEMLWCPDGGQKSDQTQGSKDLGQIHVPQTEEP